VSSHFNSQDSGESGHLNSHDQWSPATCLKKLRKILVLRSGKRLPETVVESGFRENPERRKETSATAMCAWCFVVLVLDFRTYIRSLWERTLGGFALRGI